MQVLQVMLAVLFSFCLERSVIRLYWDYKSEEDRRRFLGTISISIIINSFIILLLVFLLRNSIQRIFTEIDFFPFYAYAILTTFLMTFALIPKNYFRLMNKAGKYVTISVLEMLTSVAFIIWFMVVNREGAEGMLKGKMFAALIMLPIFLFITLRHVKFSFDIKILTESMRFSLPIIPTLIAAWALGQFDRILIAKYFTLSDVGIFSLSKRIAGLVATFSGSFMLAYHPIFFELAGSDDQINARRKLKKYNNTYIIVLSLFAFLVALFAREIIVLFLDARFHTAYVYIPFIVLSILITSISSTVIGASFQQSKKMKQDMYIGVSAAVFTVIMGYVLIRPFGINGAVGVTLVSSVYIFIIGLIYANRKCYAVLVEWKKIVLNLTAMFVLVLFFTFITINNIYLSLLIKSLALIVLSIIYYIKYKNEILVLIGKKNITTNS